MTDDLEWAREGGRTEHCVFWVQVHDSIGEHQVRRGGKISSLYGVAKHNIVASCLWKDEGIGQVGHGFCGTR